MPPKVRNSAQMARRLRVEDLEDRRLLAVLTVQNDLDDTLVNLAGDGELSLREAIEIANNPGTVIDGFVSNDIEDTIEFARPFFDEPRTIALEAGELQLNEAAFFVGTSSDLVVLDAKQHSRIFGIADTSGDVSFANLTLLGGAVEQDAINFGDDRNNGGAVRSDSVGNIHLFQSKIVGNQTSGLYGHGGAISTVGSLTISRSQIENNSTHGEGARGGAIYAFGKITIEDSRISGNQTTGRLAQGGGISSTDNIHLTSTIFFNNATRGHYSDGGAIRTYGSVSAKSTSFSENYTAGTDSDGGGISALGDISLVDSTVSGNYVSGDYAAGGAIYTTRSVEITRTILSGNSTNGNGDLSSENVASVSGGGIQAFRNVVLTDSTVFGNSTRGLKAMGGGIFAREVFAFGSTISGNSTSGQYAFGGGIYSYGDGVSITSSTVAANESRGSGGGIFIANRDSNTEVRIANSIVAGNIAYDHSADLATETSVSLTVDYSVIGDTTGTDIDNNTGIGNLLNVDPLLGPLADNGGPTRTHALLPGSPALDAGSMTVEIIDDLDPDFDQRGEQRYATGVLAGIPGFRIDIGAYEAQQPPLADYDGNFFVGGNDFLVWQRGFGMTNATPHDGDSDYDGDVDHSDLAAWQVSYGDTILLPPVVELSVGSGPLSVVQHDERLYTLLAAQVTDEGDDEPEHLVESHPVDIALRSTESATGIDSATSDVVEVPETVRDETRSVDEPRWLADELIERVFG